MSVLHPRSASHPIHTVHRVGALLLGGFLVAFGIIGLTRATEFMSTFGTSVFGLSTNGLLATVSVVVGLLLLGAAARGGPAASTVLIVVGVLFLLSGLVNVLAIGTSMNMLAFAPANVMFSLVVGAALLIVGAYGRITGRLPLDSPYSDLERAPVRAEARPTTGPSTASWPTRSARSPSTRPARSRPGGCTRRRRSAPTRTGARPTTTPSDPTSRRGRWGRTNPARPVPIFRQAGLTSAISDQPSPGSSW